MVKLFWEIYLSWNLLVLLIVNIVLLEEAVEITHKEQLEGYEVLIPAFYVSEKTIKGQRWTEVKLLPESGQGLYWDRQI